MQYVNRCLGTTFTSTSTTTSSRATIRCTATIMVAMMMLALLGLSTTEVRANDSCNCQANVTRNVTFCIGGTNYTANVSFCEVDYAPPYPAGACNTLGQNRKSTLRKICFTGTQPTGYTDAQIIGYLLCHIQSTACNTPPDPPNPYGFTVPNNGVYCWEIKVPKCTMRDNGCIVPCGDCKYCIWPFQWTRAGGVCVAANFQPCNGPDCVGTGCTQNDGCPGLLCCP